MKGRDTLKRKKRKETQREGGIRIEVRRVINTEGKQRIVNDSEGMGEGKRRDVWLDGHNGFAKNTGRG